MIILLIIIISINFKNLSAHEKIFADSHGPISIMGDHEIGRASCRERV